MSWNPGGRRGYHHGNLREALVRAALDLIAEKGVAGFTFADAARSAGVSSAAPYRHFRDREALLADVARRGFDLFAEKLNAAWADGNPDLYRAFENLGRAYLRFARDEPAFYSAMFEAGLPLDSDTGLRQASEQASAILRKAVEALTAKLPKESRPPALMMSLHIWAMTHGIASLFARGDAGRRRLPMTPDDLLEAGVLIYMRGVGVLEPPKPAS
jgi:AcrR family transcriptional regulator